MQYLSCAFCHNSRAEQGSPTIRPSMTARVLGMLGGHVVTDGTHMGGTSSNRDAEVLPTITTPHHHDPGLLRREHKRERVLLVVIIHIDNRRRDR